MNRHATPRAWNCRDTKPGASLPSLPPAPRRRSAARSVAVCAAACVLITGCGPARSGSLGRAPTGSPRPSATTASPTPSQPVTTTPGVRPPATGGATPTTGSSGNGNTASGRTITFDVWLVRDGKLFVTRRTRPTTVATGRLALTTLIQGATAAEAAAGVTSPIAAGTSFDISLRDGVATVDLPASFYSGGRELARLRQAQVVYTLTQYPTITKVGFLSAGTATGWPLGRADYADHLPPILVAGPVIGQRVTSPVTVSGTADVFEATVSVRIRDARGAQIAATFTTATCGSGCRGRYSVAVRYSVGTPQRGTVEVYSVSAKDGSDQHLVRVPVTLS